MAPPAEVPPEAIRTLLIDNYDSYSYNLLQILAVVNGELPTVIYNDELDWPALQQQIAAGRFHNIVISPGPGTPSRPGDIGVCMPLLQAQLEIPILGVCLGFQALALAHGGQVTHAPEPVHGRLSAVQHSRHPLFRDIPSGEAYQVVRYHSLLVDWPSLPACLEPIAWTAGCHHALNLAGQAPSPPPPPAAQPCNGAQPTPGEQEQPLLMGIAHRSLPHFGVQFHPESVATGFGPALLRNFRDLTARFWGLPEQPPVANLAGPPGRCMPPLEWRQPCSSNNGSLNGLHANGSSMNGSSSLDGGSSMSGTGGTSGSGSSRGGATLGVHHQRLPAVLERVGGSQRLFWELFGAAGTTDTFWLDSATIDRGRFSYMGGPGGPLWQRITYQLPPPLAGQHAAAVAGSDGPQSPSLQNAVNGMAASSTQQAEQQSAANGPAAANGAVASSMQQAAQGAANGSAAANGVPAADGVLAASSSGSHLAVPRPGTVVAIDSAGREARTTSTLWAYLEQQLLTWRCRCGGEEAGALPFDFWGGFVGYLGYELKAECGGSAAHVSPLPDASLFLADQLLAVDHHTGDVYVLALYDDASSSSSGGGGSSNGSHSDGSGSGGRGNHGDGSRNCCNGGCGGGGSGGSGSFKAASLSEAQAWVAELAAKVQAMASAAKQRDEQGQQQRQQEQEPRQREQQASAGQLEQRQEQAARPPFKLREGHQRYLQNVQACMQALYDGESYEVCLTTMLQRQGAPDAWQLYSTLRAINPAPYAAWLHFGGSGPQVCCSSPERFLRMGRGGVLEAKPIKGTARRSKDPERDAASAAELAASEKDRAENLMIVDLLRNDLGRVCAAGSVHVPGLMEIESYATVHQMVSTVRGLRRQGCSAIDCIRAAFPGGSMTGAPKVRTMEIIDKLEQGPRGVYSGSIGYIGLNDTFDLNIVIRTAVLHEDRISIGAGGAIVVQSDPQGEYEEMRLKAAALLRAVCVCDGSGTPAAVDDSS